MLHDMQSLSQTGHGSAVPGSSSDIAHQQSLLGALLPGIVKRRITTVRSFRALASTIIRPSLHCRSTSGSSNDSVTPPPPYTSEPPSEDEEEDMDIDFTSAPSSRPSTSGSATPLAMPVGELMRPDSIQSAENLIRFKFANHGLLLVAQSAHESRSSVHANDEYQRRLYLDGITYLLRGLPDELNEEERTKLKAALPDAMRDSPQAFEVEPRTYRRRGAGTAGLPYLRLIVQTIVFWTFYAFATALPHVKRLVGHAYAFERRHKVGEQFLAQILALAQVGYNQVLAFLCAVWAMNDGMVGRTLTEIGVWCAQNVGEGVRDGLSEAAAALRRTAS